MFDEHNTSKKSNLGILRELDIFRDSNTNQATEERRRKLIKDIKEGKFNK